MFTFNKSGASSYGFELSDQSDNSSTQFPYTVDMSQSLMSGRDTTRRYIYRIEQMEADAVIWGPYKYFTERQKDNCRRVFFYGLRPGEITVKEEIKQEEADEVEDPTEKNRWKSQHRLKTSLQKGDEPIGDIFDEVHMVGASDPEHFTEFRDLVYQFDDDEEDCWRKIRHKLKHANLRMPKMPMPHRY